MTKFLIALTLFAGHAYGLGCSGYTKQYDITIQPGQITGTLANYTMLISGTFAGGASIADLRGTGSSGPVTSAFGYDIIFHQANTPLVWNMPVYNAGTGQFKANVLVPAAANGSVVSMCVGNAAISTFRGGVNAYDSFTKIALQFSAAAIGLDSTGQNTTLTNNGAVHVTTGPAALVDAASFAGAQSLSGGPGNFPTGNSARTMSFWLNEPALSEMVYVAYGGAGASFAAIAYPAPWTRMTIWDGGGVVTGVSSTITTAGWHKWEIMTNPANSGMSFYNDGAYVGSLAPTLATTLGEIVIGRMVASAGSQYPLTGQLAEVRISSINRPPEWITAEFNNQSNPSAFYSIASIAVATPPFISGLTITANSAISVKAVWSTDVPSNSQVQCGSASGGPYTYASSIVNPNPIWSVMAHVMASNPMPNGTYYCIVASLGLNGAIAMSAETLVTLPAMPVSTPIAVVGQGPMSRINDRFNGMYGAPATRTSNTGDTNFFFWADDNNEYLFSTQWGNSGGGWPLFNGTYASLGMSYVQMTDALHTTGSLIGADWQNGITNAAAPGDYLGTNGISVNGNSYIASYEQNGLTYNLMKSPNHLKSILSPQSNFGPDSTYITNMTCSAGTVTATAKLAGNMTAQRAKMSLPLSTAMSIEGATGANVNGLFGPVTSNTATTVSWAQSCASWSWSPAGGTGSGGGTITTYGWDVPTGTGASPAFYSSFVQTDANDYQKGTAWAGMDSFVYFWAATWGTNRHVLCRMRIEDMPLQDYAKAGCYVGGQNGDDGIYDANWDYSTNKLNNGTILNRPQFDLSPSGKGASYVQSLYVTAFHRYLYAREVSVIQDSNSGGTSIYEGGPYPWSRVTMIGDARRNIDKYFHGAAGPEFPQFVAKSQVYSNGVTSINLAHSGNNFGGSANPDLNEYTLYMSPDYQFAARNLTAVAKLGLAAGEVQRGMDVAYNFDVLTGSESMPNAAPADAKQKWGWVAFPMMIDNYGSTWFTQPSTAANAGYPTTLMMKISTPTPYAQALTGPLTVINCFGHYPTTLLADQPAGAIAMKKGTDLILSDAGARAGAATLVANSITAIAVANGGSGYLVAPVVKILGFNGQGTGATATTTISGGVVTAINVTSGGSGYGSAPIITITPLWNVNFLGTNVGNVLIPDNSIGCVVVRRDSLNKVSLYTSAGIQNTLPLTVSATANVPGAWSTSPLVIGDPTNPFFGIESLLRVWSRDLADDELISEMAAIRGVLWSRGKGSAIP